MQREAGWLGRGWHGGWGREPLILCRCGASTARREPLILTRAPTLLPPTYLQVKGLRPMSDPSSSLPFVHTILSTLRKELQGGCGLGGAVVARSWWPWLVLVQGWLTMRLPALQSRAASPTPLPCLALKAHTAARTHREALTQVTHVSSCMSTTGTEATLLGFVGTPWTLAAYSMEGKAEKDCKETKKIMMNDPALLHAFLNHLTEALIVYAGYQIEAGAQVGADEGRRAGKGIWGTGMMQRSWEKLAHGHGRR